TKARRIDSQASSAPALPAWPGRYSPPASPKTGRPRAKCVVASPGSSMRTIGQSRPTRAAACRSTSAPSMTRNGGRRSALRACQALRRSSGPTPAGSPSDTARGGSMGSVIVDHRVAAQVAKVALGALADALVLELGQDRRPIRFGRSGRRVVAPAHHQHANALGDRAERRRRLAEIEFENRALQRLRQRPDGDLIADDLGPETGGGAIRLAAAANLGHRLLEARDALARDFLGRALGELDRDLLEADHRVARIGHTDLALVDQVENREAARNLDRTDELTGAELPRDLLELRILQLLQADPAEVAADRRSRGFGELPGIGDEAAAFAQFLDDAPGMR